MAKTYLLKPGLGVTYLPELGRVMPGVPVTGDWDRFVPNFLVMVEAASDMTPPSPGTVTVMADGAAPQTAQTPAPVPAPAPAAAPAAADDEATPTPSVPVAKSTAQKKPVKKKKG